MMTPKANQIIGGHYQIVKQLGEGTFGVTYQAIDTRSRNDFCVIKQLKVPLQSPSNGEKEKELFEREAAALHKIKNHRSPYLPQFYANFSDEGETYIVQEFIEGYNLREELYQQEKLSESAVIKLLQDGLEGLKFLHAQGLIHRDIKPANLMRRTSDNSIVIIDLGAVKEKQERNEITQSQTRIGTIGYNPPEQDKGILIDSTDIYALGVTAIEALTGIKAHEIKNLKGNVQWPEGLTINPELKILLERMVEDDYQQRYYGTANHALNDLKKILKTSQSTALTSAKTTYQPTVKPVSQMTQFREPKSLAVLILAVIGTVFLIGITSFVGFLIARQFSPQTSQPTPKPSIETSPSPSPISTSFQFTQSPSFKTPNLITAFAISKDGKTAIFGHNKGKISIWNLQTQTKLTEFVIDSEKITALTINEDGSYLAVGNKIGTISIWNLSDLQNPSKRYELNHQEEIKALAINSQGNILVSGGLVNTNKTIKIWELQAQKGRLMETPSVNQGINSLDINQDGSVIVGGDYQGTIIAWKPDNNPQQNIQYLPEARTIEKGYNEMYVSIDADGKTMISSSCNKNIVLVQNLQTNPTTQVFESDDDICLVAMNPKGDLVAGLSLQGNLIIWDSLQQKEIDKISVISNQPETIKSRLITFSDDGKTLIVVLNSEVKTWRIL
ncbi:MAG: protein kinase [Microcystaceae cyanobacterium]